MSIDWQRLSPTALGVWTYLDNQVTIYHAGTNVLWAKIKNRWGENTAIPSERIHGGINRNMLPTKLIRLIREMPAKSVAVVLYDGGDGTHIHVLLPLHAAGKEDEIALEHAKKLIEEARGCRTQSKYIVQDVLDLYMKAINLLREIAKKRQIDVEKDIKALEKEIFDFQLSDSTRLFLPAEEDQKLLREELTRYQSVDDPIGHLRVITEYSSEKNRSCVQRFICAYSDEIVGRKVSSANNYHLLTEAHCKKQDFFAAFSSLEKVFSLLKEDLLVIADFLEKLDRKMLEELFQQTKRAEITRWLLQKDAVRMTFESHLVSLKTLSKRQRPTCFVCFSVEEDVRQWLLKALLPDLHLLGVKPLCSSTDLNPGMRLEAFQDFIKNAEKVIIICTPELQRKCKERGMDRDGGSACEIALILPRCYGAQKLDEKGIIPLFLKGDRKFSLPVNFLEDIFGTVLNDRDPGVLVYDRDNQEVGVLSYYRNAFRLFGSILDIDAGTSDGIKCNFNAALENIFRGTIDEQQVQDWKSKKRGFVVPLDQISMKEALVHTASSCELFNRFLCTFQTRLDHYPQMVQALEYYVDLNATTAYRRNQLEDLGDRLKRFLEGTKTFMLIQGDTGSGKSTFVYHITKNLLERYRLNISGVIPILIELKEISCNAEKKVENFFERYLKERIGLTDKDIYCHQLIETRICDTFHNTKS